LPLLAAFGFLSKAVDRIVEKALEATGVEHVICIAHEDCAGYKAENVRFLDTAVRKVTGGSIRDTQIAHLRKAARRLQLGLRGMTVRAFFADVSDTADPRVTFKEIDITHR
jgi:carbonic anhydrase